MVGEGEVLTLMVTDAVAEPALLVAVSVYVVVLEGATTVEPLAVVKVALMGAIVTEVAPVVLQLKVTLVPLATEDASAVKEAMIGRLALPDPDGELPPELPEPPHAATPKLPIIIVKKSPMSLLLFPKRSASRANACTVDCFMTKWAVALMRVGSQRSAAWAVGGCQPIPSWCHRLKG